MKGPDPYSMSIGELWGFVISEDGMEGVPIREEYKDDLKKVLWGFNITFLIHKIIDEHYKEYPEYNTIYILGIGEVKDIEFNIEKDLRRAALIKIVAENIEEAPLTEPREFE